MDIVDGFQRHWRAAMFSRHARTWRPGIDKNIGFLAVDDYGLSGTDISECMADSVSCVMDCSDSDMCLISVATSSMSKDSCSTLAHAFAILRQGVG